MKKIYVLTEQVGNYSVERLSTQYFNEIEEYLQAELYRLVEGDEIDINNEVEVQNFYSYYSITEKCGA